MDSNYTITIKGPEGTEIYEGEGFLMLVQHRADNGVHTQIVGQDFDDADLAYMISKNSRLAPIAFGAVGFAIGKRFAPPDPADLMKLIKAIGGPSEDSEEDE